MDFLGSSFRFANKILFLFKPADNEVFVFNRVLDFLRKNNINLLKKILLPCVYPFDFLDWNFKISGSMKSFSTPSCENYELFLKRIKHIINNSNYGAVRIKIKMLNFCIYII